MKLKFLNFLLCISITACASNYPIHKVTVMVTNLQSDSGGSGSIVFRNTSYSEVLTNLHVCQNLKRGGLVHTYDGKSHTITSFKQSHIHDLCLIRVAEDLKFSTNLEYVAPKFSEESIVSGHPRLLPTIINFGHFSDKIVVKVAIGVRDCTKQEQNDSETGLLCLMVGKLPIIKNYEAIVISNLIQPGSSGSPVFNGNRKLSAVVFAGSGEISYGLAVPYEYVKRFLSYESKFLKNQIPDLTVSLTSNNSEDSRSYMNKILNVCTKDLKNQNNSVCNELRSTTFLGE